jgi:hypothetical protein
LKFFLLFKFFILIRTLLLFIVDQLISVVSLKRLLAMAVTLSAAPLFAQTESPLIGAIKVIQTPVCRIDVTWNGKRSVFKNYVPPAGWQILSAEPVIISSKEKASDKIVKTPSTFVYKSTSSIYSAFIELFELAAQKNVYHKYEAQISQMRSDFEKLQNKEITTYSHICTIASARGNNSSANRRAGRLYLDLAVTLMYMPDTEAQFLRSLEDFKQVIYMEE